jgi:hypothetical protein
MPLHWDLNRKLGGGSLIQIQHKNKNMASDNNNSTQPSTPTSFSKWIAVISLGVFCLIIVLCFVRIMVVEITANDSAAILQTGKDGLLILGGVVSTVIGYYFGGRNGERATELANAQTANAQQELRAANETLRSFNINNK